jgi:MinD superfamily P-loop ATPase
VIIAVASGKGGTGKTTVATSLALTLAPDRPVFFLDCDVEAPNAHLLLKPSFAQKKDASILLPVIDESRCNQSGICAEVCQYNAIAVTGQQVLVFPEMCHGCGSCALNCAREAIREVPHVLGTLESGHTPEGIQFARGVLNVGEALAVPVIRRLRTSYPAQTGETIIVDAPPGTSCPVVESVRDADYVLLVTEPTPFGLHDLRLAYELTRKLGLPAGVIINRDGIGDQGVDDFCTQAGLPVLLRIPMDREIAAGIAQGIPLVTLKREYQSLFREIFVAIARVSL